MGYKPPAHPQSYTVNWLILDDQPVDYIRRIAESFEAQMTRRMPGRVSFNILTHDQFEKEYGKPANLDTALDFLYKNTIQIVVYPTAVLGEKIREAIHRKMNKIPEKITPWFTGETDYTALDMPYAFRSEEHANSFFQSGPGEKVLYYNNFLNIKSMAIVPWGSRRVIAGDKPFTTPEDFEGAKIKTQYGTALEQDIFESLGAEVSGDADAYETDLVNLDSSKKYVTELNHSINGYVVLASHPFWRHSVKCECDYRDHTPEEEDHCLRKQMKRACNEAARANSIWNDSDTENLRNDLKEKGVQFFSIDDIDAFKEKTRGVYDKYMNKFTPTLFDHINETCDKEESVWCDKMTVT